MKLHIASSISIKLILLIILFNTCTTWVLNGQTSIRFIRTYGNGGLGEYYLHDVKYVASDSGYVAIGEERSLGRKFFAVKTDKWGRPQWMITLDNSQTEHGHGIIPTSDGNYVLVGQTKLGGTDKGDIAIVKVNGSGTSVLWAIHLGSGVSQERSDAISVIEHSSGNYIVAGLDTILNGPGLREGALVAVDPNGNVLWHACIGESSDDVFEDVIEGHNGNIIAVGKKDASGYLVEVDPTNGSLISTKVYTVAGIGGVVFNGIARKPSGGYVVTGASISLPSSMLVVSLDNQFNVLWSNVYQAPFDSWGNDVVVKGDTIYIVGHAESVNNTANRIPVIVAIDANTGNIIWDIGFDDSNPAHSIPYKGIDLTPTGPVIAGWKGIVPLGLIAKTDFSGMVIGLDTCVQVDVNLTKNAFPLSVSSGGTAKQRLNVNNLSISISQITGHDSICVTSITCTPIVLDSMRVDTVQCPGDTSAMVYFWFSGTTGPVTHHLSNGQIFTGDTIGPLPEGAYTDTIFGTAGCPPIIVSFNISSKDSVEITAIDSSAPSSCGASDGWIKITVAGGTSPYNVSWSNGASGDSIGGLAQGTYIVYISDVNGCSTQDTITLTAPNNLNVQVVTFNPLCYGDSSGWIKVSVTGGSSPYTHVWSNGMTGDSIYGLPAGIYIDSIYDASGCWTMDTIQLTNPAPLNVASLQTAPPSSCNASDGWIKVSAGGGIPPYTYSWSNGANGDSIGNLSDGTYIVTITDSVGCSMQDTITLQGPGAPQVSGVSVRPPTCNGDSTGIVIVTVTGGTPPYTHNWSNGTTTTSDTLIGIPAGTYVDTIIDATGCMTLVSVEVNEPPQMDVTVQTNSPSSCSAQDGMAVAIPSGGIPPYSYSWSNGTTDDTLQGIGPGVYSVIVTDSLGCTDSATVLLTSPDAPSFSVSSELISCSPPSFQIEIAVNSDNSPFVIYWIGYDTTTQLIDTLPPGNYIVIVEDNGGCQAFDTITLRPVDTVWAEVSPQVDTISPGDSVLLNANTNGGIWWWSPGAYLNDSLSLNPVAVPVTTTTFYFHSYNGQGCYDIDTVIIVVEGEPIVYFPDYFSPNGDGSNDLYRPIYWGDVKIMWKVYNRWSQIVFEGDEQDAWDGTLNGKPQAMDSYVLVATIIPKGSTQETKPTVIRKNILLIR